MIIQKLFNWTITIWNTIMYFFIFFFNYIPIFNYFTYILCLQIIFKLKNVIIYLLVFRKMTNESQYSNRSGYEGFELLGFKFEMDDIAFSMTATAVFMILFYFGLYIRHCDADKMKNFTNWMVIACGCIHNFIRFGQPK